jgi:exosortase family protein XrtG
MTWPLLLLLAVLYLGGLVWIRRKKWYLRAFVWGAFGQAYLFLQVGLLLGLAGHLAAWEAQHLQALFRLAGVEIQVFEEATLLVPDDQGWTSMTIGIESSTLIEMTVCSGLVLHYPGLSRRRRGASLLAGIGFTYLLNLLRLAIIILIVLIWGRSAFVIAHALIGRLIYFAGVLALYWYLLTRPTVRRVQQSVRERDV